jgi:hypothetical protein
MASLRHRFAKTPSAGQIRPRRRTAKGPGKRVGERKKEAGKRYRSFLFYVEKSVDREKVSTHDWDLLMTDEP